MSEIFVREHDEEPVLGMPERLPNGERLLWQGSPNTWRLLLELFHFRKIVFYFVLIAQVRMYVLWREVGTLSFDYLLTPLAFLAGAAVLLGLLAYLYARTTVYSITSRRITLRYGVAFPIVLNIPFAELQQASVQKSSPHFGNLAFQISDRTRLSWAVLWPNVRPWCFSKPQPLLRGVENVDEVAALLQSAVGDMEHKNTILKPLATKVGDLNSRLVPNTDKSLLGDSNFGQL